MLFLKTVILFVLAITIVVPVKAFNVYWNSPTQQCLCNDGQDFAQLLTIFGILVNDEDKFQGNEITIFYDAQLGLYPQILKNGTFQNGGLPQAGNLSKHLEKSSRDLQNIIPSRSFDGVGVLDWEAWRPSWNFNWEPLNIYREKSKELAKKNNPSLNDKEIQELAIKQWEQGSKSYMLETLLLAKKLRPFATWGYYIFPDCYNYVGEAPEDFECSKNVKTENDKLSWLWKSSTGIYPSVYLHESYLDKYSLEQRSWRDNGMLKEAIRVADTDAKVLPYVNYYLETQMVPKEDFRRIVAQVAAIGADGLIIWGSSASVNSKSRCDNLKNYIIDTLGPAIERVSWNSKLCSKRICNGNGQCTWPGDKSVIAWKLFLSDSPSFYAGDVVCRCSAKYTGRFCEKSIWFI